MPKMKTHSGAKKTNQGDRIGQVHAPSIRAWPS